VVKYACFEPNFQAYLTTTGKGGLRSEYSLTYSDDVTTKAVRAHPLAPEERRAAIVEAAIPLFIEHGSDVTTRQIADAAGIAEGTVFRVFADKDAIVDAVVAKYLDPTPTLHRLAEIPYEFDLEQTIVAMVDILRERITGVVGIMHAVGMRKHPPHPPRQEGDAAQSVAVALLARYRDQLAVPPEQAVEFLRAAVFGSSVVPFSGAETIEASALAHFIINGIQKG